MFCVLFHFVFVGQHTKGLLVGYTKRKDVNGFSRVGRDESECHPSYRLCVCLCCVCVCVLCVESHGRGRWCVKSVCFFPKSIYLLNFIALLKKCTTLHTCYSVMLFNY